MTRKAVPEIDSGAVEYAFYKTKAVITNLAKKAESTIQDGCCYASSEILKEIQKLTISTRGWKTWYRNCVLNNLIGRPRLSDDDYLAFCSAVFTIYKTKTAVYHIIHERMLPYTSTIVEYSLPLSPDINFIWLQYFDYLIYETEIKPEFILYINPEPWKKCLSGV